MKHYFLMFACAFTLFTCDKKAENKNIVTSDVENFWNAYDKIVTTKDSTLQLEYLNTLFIDKGTSGLKAIMEARRYQPNEYVKAINKYPLYWNSIRENTETIGNYADEIQDGIKEFKLLYPTYRDAKVYFEIGVFRTPGTTMDSLVLIGSELAMTNSKTNISELPETMNYVKDYTKSNPINDLAFLNVHEFVHTQQNAPWAYDLLSQSVFEGSAEFLAELATKKPSKQLAIAYGTQNDSKVKERFSKEMFSPWYYNWIWNDTNNDFKTRDLGYYLGYAIVKKHYDAAKNKEKAISEIIELDFTDSNSLENFVESTHYFNDTLSNYKILYEKNRPTVHAFEGLQPEQRNVNSELKTFTIHFSEPMDTRFRSTDFGPLGKDHFPELKDITFSDNGKSATYFIQLKPETDYEMLIDYGYRTKNAIPLQPYLLKFSTK